jgi:hypothetical protein
MHTNRFSVGERVIWLNIESSEYEGIVTDVAFDCIKVQWKNAMQAARYGKFAGEYDKRIGQIDLMAGAVDLRLKVGDQVWCEDLAQVRRVVNRHYIDRFSTVTLRHLRGITSDVRRYVCDPRLTKVCSAVGDYV